MGGARRAQANTLKKALKGHRKVASILPPSRLFRSCGINDPKPNYPTVLAAPWGGLTCTIGSTRNLIGPAIGVGVVINPVPFVIGIGTTKYAAGYTASDKACLHGVVSTDNGTKKSTRYGTTYGATQDLRDPCPMVCNIARVGSAIAPATCVGRGGDCAKSHNGYKGGGDNFASGHDFLSSIGLRRPLPR